MSRNKRHSRLDCELREEKHKFQCYLNERKCVVMRIKAVNCNPYEQNYLRDLQGELKDIAFMLNIISKKIRDIKSRIYTVQYNFSKTAV